MQDSREKAQCRRPYQYDGINAQKFIPDQICVWRDSSDPRTVFNRELSCLLNLVLCLTRASNTDLYQSELLCKYGGGIFAQKHSSRQELLKSSSRPAKNFCAYMAMADMHNNSLWYSSVQDRTVAKDRTVLERELSR